MRHHVHGAARGRHVALVGVWDPILPAYETLFAETVARAARDGREVAVVTLDPPPLIRLRGAAAHPTFHDVAARQFFQRHCGVQTQIRISLTQREVEMCGAEWLLTRLCELVAIDELVLGVAQSFGRGEAGGQRAIGRFCDPRGIAVRSLPHLSDRPPVNEARELLRAGRLGRAVTLLSYPFSWSRPRAADLRLPWPPGRYRAVALRTPAPLFDPASAAIDVELEPHDGLSRLRWPARDIGWLAFLGGPGDSARDFAPARPLLGQGAGS